VTALVVGGGSLVPGSGAATTAGPFAVGVDKWLHAAGYAALTAATWYGLVDAGDGHGRRRRTGVTVAVALAVAVTLGVVVELAQTAVPGRAFDPLDLAANAVGATVAAVLCATLARRVRFRPWGEG